jgi:hypothetical protein
MEKIGTLFFFYNRIRMLIENFSVCCDLSLHLETEINDGYAIMLHLTCIKEVS